MSRRSSAILTLTVALSALFVVHIALAANPAGVGTKAAEDSVKAFKVAEGLEATLFAAEPMLVNPTDIDVDARGRVWVAEGSNYRSTFQRWGILRPEGDRIVVLEDTDADGKADKETVFYQDPSINAALGVCVLGNKVIVSDSPNVFLLTDTDGDGKADKRELLFTGISGVDHDHGVHAFVFGPDGKLYFNMGNEGKQLRRPVTRELPLHGKVANVASEPVVDIDGNEINNKGQPYRMGMVFRCNLDGSDVETLAWNFRNNYEVAVDSFGTLWQSDNDDDGNRGVRINYVMEYGNFGYADEMTGAGWHEAWDAASKKGAREEDKVFYEWHQYDPGVVPNLLHTGAGSPTGIAVYEGKLLPEVFRNQLIHCDAGPRVVRAYVCEPDGAGYKATIKDIVSTADSWFRPSDVCITPDGSLFVADWNDAGVGGHNMADQKLETMTGRIYRIAPPGHKPKAPKLDLQSTRGCVEALQSPNIATRYLAWTELHNKGASAEKDLVGLWKGKEPRMRARALQLLARIPGQEKKYIGEAIKDRDPDVRITGLRIARALKSPQLIPSLELLAKDTSPQVRRECAIALRHNKASQAQKLWAELAVGYGGDKADEHRAAGDGGGASTNGDRSYVEALGIGADKQWDQFLAAWIERAGKWDTAAGREIIWRSRSSKTADLLSQIISNEQCSPADRDHYFRSFDFLPKTYKDKALIALAENESRKGPARAPVALEALNRLKVSDVSSNERLTTVLANLLEQVRGTAQFVELVRQFKVKGQERGVLEVAEKNPQTTTGADAVKMLLFNSSGVELLKDELGGSNALSVVKALGSAEKNESVPLLSPLVGDSSRDTALRKQVVKALADVHDGAALLVSMAREQKLPEDVKFTASSALSTVRWDDLKHQARELLPLPQAQNAQPLPPISELIKMHGDANRGATVFRREAPGCIKCHQVKNEGIDFGPSLTDIGTKLGKDALYESILDPSAGISFGYEAYQLALKNGDEAYGIIVSETADELSLKGVNGIVTKYKKTEIANRARQKLSAMPSGLQQTMSMQEMVDLVEYLASLKK